MGVGAGVGAAAVVFYISRAMAGEKPKTMSKEWEEASNEMAKEQNMDPITGISSEGYKGKGECLAPLSQRPRLPALM